jgi:signal transduction histidine kinase
LINTEKPVSRTKRENNKLRRYIVSILAFLSIAFSLVYFIFGMKNPYMGVELALQDQVWVVLSLDDSGLASQAGVHVGDSVVTIDGQQSDLILKKYVEMGYFRGMAVREMTTIDISGKATSVSIEQGSQSTQSIIEISAWLIVCLIFWAISGYVFFKRPENTAALSLFICGMVLGIVMSSTVAAQSYIFFATEISVLATIFGPWVLLHFFLLLPDERVILRKSPWVHLIYLVPLVTAVLYLTVGQFEGQALPGFRNNRMFEMIIAFSAVAVVAVLNYIQATSPRTRQQLKIVAISCLFALVPFLILNVLPEAVMGKPFIAPGLGFLFIAFIPVGMGYAVVTQKLMDIDLVIRRSVLYGLITVIMGMILSAALIPIMYFRPSVSLAEGILLSLVLGGAATALFGPTKKGIETLIDKFLYKDRYDYRQIIHRASTSLNSLKDFDDISRFIVGTVIETLNLSGACLFVWKQSGYLAVDAAGGTFSALSKQDSLRELITNRNSMIEFPNSASSANPETAFLIPLKGGDKEYGILCLSRKATLQNFSSDDIFLLQGLASVTTVAMRSATLIQDVSARDTFVSIASHELRTPLTSILGYAELLLRRDISETRRKQWLEIIMENSQKLTDMVDDLLNVSRIQSGKLGIKLEGIKLPEALDERLAITRESTNKHTIVVEIEPELPEIRVDRDKFVQVIGNILNNAIKYSPDGGKVTLSAYHDKSRQRVVVRVSDEGMGISPADKASLFSTFHRIQRPETMGIRGSGLGLYIVKEWTEAMGGEVWLESELNIGSSFFVAVPTSDSNGTGDKKLS